ncbi:MAG: type II secretion system protein [Candidatus Saccharimonas sp.]
MSNTYNYHHPIHSKQTSHSNNRGFTIVELLIVIVVIAILAAISIVAYNGIQNRAYDTTIQSDLRQTYIKIQDYNISSGKPLEVVNDSVINEAQKTAINSVFVTTRSAYSDANALLVCSGNGTTVIVARSKSGNGFYYSTVRGSGSLTSWPGDGNANLCPAVGVPTNATNYEFLWIKTYEGWHEWFAAGK